MIKRILLTLALLAPLTSHAAISGTARGSVSDSCGTNDWGTSACQVDISGVSGFVANDLLIYTISRNDDSFTAACPTGFTLSQHNGATGTNTVGGLICWKKASGSETTIQGNLATGQQGRITVWVFPGTDLNLSAEEASSQDNSNSAGTTHTSGSATNASDALGIAVIATDDGIDNAVSAWSNSWTSQGGSGSGLSQSETFLATKVLSASASQSTTATITSDQAWGGILLFAKSVAVCPATCAGGRTGVCITNTASNTDPDNILYDQSPAVVANEDTICHDATSTNGAAVTVSSAGWVSLASGGSNLTDSFTYCLMDNGAACGSDGTFQVTQTPVLSNPTGTATGQTTATLGVDVDQVEGTVYACVSADSGTPSHAQIAAGNDANGAACVYDASDATPSASQGFSATGLTADTVYYASFGQSNAATTPLTATVVRSAAFQTEAAGDTTPDAFSFTDLTGVNGGEVYTSSEITIAGTTAATNVIITIAGCEYAIDSGSGYGSYTSAAGVVQLGYGVRLRNTASLEALNTANCTPTIGGVSDTWTITTKADSGRAFIHSTVQPTVNPTINSTVY